MQRSGRMDVMDKNEIYRQRKFVENFMEFGALHRARVALGLVERLRDEPNENRSVRASLMLEIVQNYLNSFEDVALWLKVIHKWTAEDFDIIGALAKARFNPAREDTLQRLIEHGLLRGGTAEDFARRHGIPLDAYFKSEVAELARLANVMGWETTHSAAGKIEIWHVWNKAKHGTFVTLSRSSEWGDVLRIHVDPSDLSDAAEIRVHGFSAINFMAKTFLNCMFLGLTLNVLFQVRYQTRPEVSWLAASNGVNLFQLNIADIRRILTSNQVPRQEHWMFGKTHFKRLIEPAYGFELVRDDELVKLAVPNFEPTEG
jgi:hypothetical protein